MKKEPRAAPPRSRSTSQLTLPLCEDVREDPLCSSEAAPLPELPARRTATGTVLRLCAPPAPEIAAAVPAPQGCCFFAAGTLAEMAQSLERLAGQWEANAQRLPDKAFSLLQIASLARFLARDMRAGRYP